MEPSTFNLPAKKLWLVSAIVFIFIATLFGDPIGIPYFQNFDEVETFDIPEFWTRYVVGGTVHLQVGVSNATYFSEPKSLFLRGSSTLSMSMISMPDVAEGIGMNELTLSFVTKSHSVGARLSIGILEESGNPDSWVELVPWFDPGSTWIPYRLNLVNYTGPGRSLAFRVALESTNRVIYIDDLALTYTPVHDLEATGFTGYQYPTALLASNFNLNVTNYGLEDQADYDVQLVDADGIVWDQVPGIPVPAGQSVINQLQFIAPQEGEYLLHGKVIFAEDSDQENNLSSALNVTAYAPGIREWNIGTGSYHHKYPIDLYWKTSLYQSIYQADELDSVDVDIYGMVIYSQIYSQDITDKPIKIWLSNTHQSDLVASWISADNMTEVFYGNVDFPRGENRVRFDFSNPFRYSSGAHLAMMVLRYLDFRYYSSMDDFYHDNTDIQRSRYSYSDTEVYDPTQPPQTAVTINTSRPKITFLVRDLQTPVSEAVEPVTSLGLHLYPNPFGKRLSLKLSSPKADEIEINLYNLKGQKVSAIYKGKLTKGDNLISYTPSVNESKTLKSGIYFIKVSTSGATSVSKVVHIAD